jgi:gamma-glutamylcyclotransferase (GGCT)/AIG2-like uncharacterized protein YtfP
MLHFAYGSNMSRPMMRKLCPAARPLGPARLDRWRFLITADGYASVVPAAGGVVHGALWRLTPRDLAALNRYESVDSGLYSRHMLPVRYAGKLRHALVYVGRTRQPGRPRRHYQEGIVVPAAADWGLPAWYIAELARFAPAPAVGRDTARPHE